MNKLLISLVLMAVAGGAAAGNGNNGNNGNGNNGNNGNGNTANNGNSGNTTGNSGNTAGNNGNSGSNNGGGNGSGTVVITIPEGKGLATLADAKLDGASAGRFAYSSVNPNQYEGGNTSGFATEFASTGTGAWTLLDKGNTGLSSGSAKIGSTTLSWGYDVTEAGTALIPAETSGTWWIKSSSAVTLDLALAVHASNASGAWLFDNLSLAANQAEDGTWQINWVNNGGNVPGFSNFTLFARDVQAAPTLSPVPEPETYAMILAALGIVGFAAKRRKQTA